MKINSKKKGKLVWLEKALDEIRGKDEEEVISTTVGHNAEGEKEDVTSKDSSGYKEKVEDEHEEKEVDTGYIDVKENPDMKRYCNVRDIFDSDSE